MEFQFPMEINLLYWTVIVFAFLRVQRIYTPTNILIQKCQIN